MAKRAKKIKSPLFKEQVVAQMKNNALFQAKMAFIKEKFWPLLCETADSIEDASTFLSGFNTALMQAFLGLMKDKKFGELGLEDKIDGEFAKYKAIVALFADMPVFEAKDYIEGMRSEIQLFIADEQRKRPLKELKATWIDDIAYGD